MALWRGMLTAILLCCGYVAVADAVCMETQDICGIDRAKDGSQIIYFLSLLPFPNPDPRLDASFDDGPTLQIVSEMALERINNASNILPGFRIEVLLEDGGCQIWSSALTGLFQHVLTSSKQVVGIVGPGCSISATTVAPQIGKNETSLLNVHIAGSPLLADRSRFGFSFSTLDSTEGFADATIALMISHEWNKIAVLFDPERLFFFSTVALLEKKVRNVPNYNVEVSSAVTEFNFPVENIFGRNIRVVFLFLGTDLFNKMLCVAFHRGLIYPVYQLVIVSRIIDDIRPTSFIYDDFNYTCSLEDLAIAANKSLIIHFQVRPNDPTAMSDTGISGNDFDAEYQARIDEYNAQDSERENITKSFYRGCFNDAVWSLALALNNSMGDVNLSNYRFGQHEASSLIRKELLALHFDGLSGSVQYDPNSGFIKRNVDIYQVTDKEMKVVAETCTKNSTCIIDIVNATYINGSFEIETVFIEQTLANTIVFLGVTVLGFIFVAIVNILNIWWIKERPVKASSPKLNQLCFIGCYFIVLAVLSYSIVFGFRSIDVTIQCNLLLFVHASAEIGFTLVFGTICAKTWRLYRIYVHFTNPGRLISDYMLFAFVLILVAIDVLILIVWGTVDHLKGFFIPQPPTIEEVGSSYVLRHTIEPQCTSEHYFVWFGLLTLLNCGLVIMAFWLALQTRRIPHKDFRTNGVIYLVYLITAVVFLGVPLLYVLLLVVKHLDSSYIVLNFTLNAVVYCTTALLLSPPVYVVVKQKLLKMEVKLTTQSRDLDL